MPRKPKKELLPFPPVFSFSFSFSFDQTHSFYSFFFLNHLFFPLGLLYKVIKGVEHGPSPLVDTPCECHYRGTLIDGTGSSLFFLSYSFPPLCSSPSLFPHLIVEFDSSYSRGKPTTFAPNQVIKGPFVLFCFVLFCSPCLFLTLFFFFFLIGWTEALQLMKEGEKWELYIPSELAYGQRRMGKITAGAVLVFELELLKVKGKSKQMEL